MTLVATPAAAGSRFPNLASASDGQTVVMSWLEPGTGDEFRLRYAQWQRTRSWGAPVEVASGAHWFVNWADFPSVVPADGGPWAAHWLQQKPGGVYAYDVMTRLSDDGGRTWSEPRSPHDDGTATEHGFVSLANVGGRPYGVWLDGRKTAGEGHAHAADDHAAPAGAMTLRGAVLTPQGAVAGSEIDARVCDCCQTDVAVSARCAARRVPRSQRRRDARHPGRPPRRRRVVDAGHRPCRWLAHRRMPREWPGRGSASATTWPSHGSPPRTNPGCAWRSRRTAVARSNRRSRSRAARWSGASTSSLLRDGRAVVSWLDANASGAVIRAQPFNRAGPAAPAKDIATSNVARSSGFPQMVEVADGLLFAWTENGSSPAVRTAFAPLD